LIGHADIFQNSQRPNMFDLAKKTDRVTKCKDWHEFRPVSYRYAKLPALVTRSNFTQEGLGKQGG